MKQYIDHKTYIVGSPRNKRTFMPTPALSLVLANVAHSDSRVVSCLC